MSTNMDEAVGARIQQLREKSGLNQLQAVKALKSAGLSWSQATLSKVESGARPLRVAELPALAAALGVSQSELLASNDPIRSWLERIRLVESMTKEALADWEMQYRDARESRQRMQLVDELCRGLDGPYSVNCSSARFVSEVGLEQFAGLERLTDAVLERLGVSRPDLDPVEVTSQADIDRINNTLPDDMAISEGFWGALDDLSVDSESHQEWIATINGIVAQHLEFLALGQEVERKYPQVTFTTSVGQHLEIVGLHESAD